MSDRKPGDMQSRSERMPEDVPERCQTENQVICKAGQKECATKNVEKNVRRYARENVRTLAHNNSCCQHVVQDTAEFGGNHFECRPGAGCDIMRGKHGGIYTCTVSNMPCR